MKITKIKSSLRGVPDYFDIDKKWMQHYKCTGDNNSKVLAMHYARVSEELGQAIIEEDTTHEVAR